MGYLLQGDPPFKPPVVKTHLGKKIKVDINDDDVVGESTTITANATSSCSISKKKRTTFRTKLENILNRGA